MTTIDDTDATYKQLKADLATLEIRINELDAPQWESMATVPEGVDVELLVRGYIGDDGKWYYRDGTEPLIAWRPVTK